MLFFSSSSGPELSMGRQEAFEIFRRDHEDRLSIDDNKAILKQRFAEAKALGEQVNQARNRVSKSLTLPISTQSLSNRMLKSDPLEERLRSQIEEEKKSYKSTFGRLKGLKTEIEHLQHLLQKSKIRLQRDFQDWWTQEASRLQVLQISQRQHRCLLLREKKNKTFMALCEKVIALLLKHTVTVLSDTSDLHSLSSSGLNSTSIPMTGDQQTDADILAFIKARQSLLTRSGT
uniref:Kinesin-like protein KIF6/9 C-terminal domain-containing protein n=1 Tax=Astyanax mexicanus TaxID=7994 RepID=A0A3B1J1R4_ASTMX